MMVEAITCTICGHFVVDYTEKNVCSHDLHGNSFTSQCLAVLQQISTTDLQCMVPVICNYISMMS